MLILQTNKTPSTFYGNSGQIFCYKKRGVSIFYRNFVARMRKGLEQETSDNRLERAVTGLNNSPTQTPHGITHPRRRS
jgi:hypothetical protein